MLRIRTRTFRRTASVALAAGAVLALTIPGASASVSPGSYAYGTTTQCAGTEKIQLELYNGLYHDFMANDPTYDGEHGSYTCIFGLFNVDSANGDIYLPAIWSEDGNVSTAESPWDPKYAYDGPGQDKAACSAVFYNGAQQTSWYCGPAN